jgi:hypothetical protein
MDARQGGNSRNLWLEKKSAREISVVLKTTRTPALPASSAGGGRRWKTRQRKSETNEENEKAGPTIRGRGSGGASAG